MIFYPKFIILNYILSWLIIFFNTFRIVPLLLFGKIKLIIKVRLYEYKKELRKQNKRIEETTKSVAGEACRIG